MFLFIDMISYSFVVEHFKGMADQGKVEKGHYFVGQHGGYNEVSRQAYFLIRYQEWSIFFLFIIVFITFLWAKFELRKKKV